MGELATALNAINLKITKYDPSKQRSISLNSGAPITLEKFCVLIKEKLGDDALKHEAVFKASNNPGVMADMVEEYAKKKKVFKGEKIIEVPPEYEGLTLNMDVSSGRDTKYFLTSPDEIVSVISGYTYIKTMQMNEAEAIATARKVLPEYSPRTKRGITKKTFEDNTEVDVFNTYIPPRWKKYKGPKTPDKLPPLFEKLVNHLFPLKIEREYFYSWLYHSMYKRAYVYLVLCGAPGTGKNRLKLVLRALHGHTNTIDGKRSTLVERFNSQLADSTLAWFDELHYDMEMENMMKELQNDSISIERKGIDATRSTNIHASLVVSNNKPRDNFLAFDARKFAPLQLSSERLEKSMTGQEIDELTKKVEKADSPDFDIAFLFQIAKWVKANGKSSKWPHLEYKGPMFYKLAHTSMSRWQKKAASLILDTNPKSSGRITFTQEKGFLWSTIAEMSGKKNGDRSLQFPDYSTVRYFFDVFVDGNGKKAFQTEELPDNIMGDFWVKKLIKDLKIITEAEASRPMNGAKINGSAQKKIHKEEDEEIYDL